jgi:3-methyladenine DNA glycosylase/8-oxoguanine DNA glycosylase
MPFSLPVPSDYRLPRDYCSYGYFLLEPNHWEPRTATLSRILELDNGPTRLDITQAANGTTRKGHPLTIRPDRFLKKPEREHAKRLLTRMLRLDESHDHIREFHKVDPRFRRSGRGRLMRSPTLFEDVIKTVTSCNVTWPSTITMNRRLCEVVGRGGAFPSSRQLARTRPATLRARCRVGYRDARIIELAELFSTPPAKGGLNQEWLEDPKTPDDDLWNTLIDLPGIGPYAAANIMQLLGRYHRLPLDSESIRHGKTVMGLKGNDRQIMKRVAKHFAPFGVHAFRSYWFELWEFYEGKHGKSWTWEKKQVGSAFTASKL